MMGILSNLQKLSVILKQFIVLLFKRKHMVGFGKNGVLSWMWVCERLFEVSLSLSVLSLWKLIVCLLFTFALIHYMYLTWWIWYSKVLHSSAKFSDLANVLHLIVNIHSEVIAPWRSSKSLHVCVNLQRDGRCMMLSSDHTMRRQLRGCWLTL